MHRCTLIFVFLDSRVWFTIHPHNELSFRSWFMRPLTFIIFFLSFSILLSFYLRILDTSNGFTEGAEGGGEKSSVFTCAIINYGKTLITGNVYLFPLPWQNILLAITNRCLKTPKTKWVRRYTKVYNIYSDRTHTRTDDCLLGSLAAFFLFASLCYMYKNESMVFIAHPSVESKISRKIAAINSESLLFAPK